MSRLTDALELTRSGLKATNRGAEHSIAVLRRELAESEKRSEALKVQILERQAMIEANAVTISYLTEELKREEGEERPESPGTGAPAEEGGDGESPDAG